MLLRLIHQAELLESKLSSFLKKVRFSKKKFPISKSVLDI